MRTVERLAYFDLYVADYLLDTTDLSLAEHGAYCLLMFRYYWQGELRAADVYRSCRSAEDRAAVDAVLGKYFHKDAETYKHNRIERELAALSEFIAHQSKAGKASAAARALKTGTKKTRVNGSEIQTLSLPPWVKPETWRAWIRIRPAKARTHDAQLAALKKLEALRAKGFDANAIVETSLANGWQGLFEPDAKARQSLAEANAAAAAEATRRFKEEHGD